MKKLVLVAFIQIFFTGLFLQAQKITLKSGSFDFLKGQKTILVKYDYSNMGVGKFDKEDDYVADKVASYNKSEAGKGDKFKVSWYADRPKRLEPKFEELFNNYAKEKDLQCTKNATGTKYEMVVHTTYTEPGFNIGITRKPAYINVEIKFLESGSGKELAVVTVEKCPGRDAVGFDFDSAYRLEEGYAKLGKSLSGFILKKM